MNRARHRPQSLAPPDMLAVKPFLKIGEVAKLLGVKPHVLRYWEAEFPSLRPKKNPSGQRIYARADIDAIVEIKNLLYNERYTISGAKKMLAGEHDSSAVFIWGESTNFFETIEHLKAHIQELLTLLRL